MLKTGCQIGLAVAKVEFLFWVNILDSSDLKLDANLDVFLKTERNFCLTVGDVEFSHSFDLCDPRASKLYKLSRLPTEYLSEMSLDTFVSFSHSKVTQ